MVDTTRYPEPGRRETSVAKLIKRVGLKSVLLHIDEL